MLTPLALLLLGVVHMARAQRVEPPSAEQGAQESELAAALAAGEVATLADAAGAPAAPSLDAAAQDLLALLQTLSEQARAATEALTQPAEAAEGGQGAGGAVAQETAAEQALTQAAVDRTGQIDRAQAILETYQSLIEQLPPDAVLAQAAASAPAAAEAAAMSSTTMLAGLLGLLALGAAGGGGGGSGGGGTPAPAATEITLHDGYIDGAKVYVDLNDNGSVDANDKFLGTTKDGKLSAVLTDSDKLHGLIAQGGIDISTNSAFIGSFSTTAGSTVINPITTVVQTLVQATVGTLAGLSNEAKAAALEEAKSTAMITVSTALGIEDDVDLTRLDTVKASASTTGDSALGVQADDAIALHSKALMLSNIISAGTAALAGATGDSTDTAALAKFVVKGIVGSINAAASQGESISFKSSDDVLQVISNAVDAAKEGGKSIDDAIMNDSSGKVAGAVATVNQIINTFAGEAANAASSGGSVVGGLTQMLQTQKVLNNQVEGLAQNNTSALNQLNTLADPSAALTQAQAQTQGLKVGTVVVVGVTERPADNVAPTVVDVDVNPARVGDLARVVVKMSEPVYVRAESAPPTLQITTSAAGAALVTATARFDAGLSSPDALVFTYRVQEGDARVAVADGAAIALPSGTVIRDLALNNANPAIATGASTDVDTLAPTVGISTSASFVKAGATALVTFTLSEAASTRSVNGFSAADVTVKNGALSDFTKVSETVYTAKLAATNAAAPAEVGVAGGRFTDQAGNGNKPSNVVTVAQEGAAPVVVLQADQSFFNSVNSSGTPQTTVKFSLSSASSDFTAEDVTVSGGGAISNFAGSGKDYTATLTGVTSLTQVKVGKDAFGVTGSTAKNGESNILNFKVDTTKPTVAIAVLKGSTGTDAVTANTTLKAGDSARVSFTLSEEGLGFGPQAVKVVGGFLENFAQDKSDPKKFTALFRPAAPEVGKPAAVVEASITVDADRFKDQAGNPNDGASASFKIDNLRPGVVSVTDDQQGVAKAGSTVTYTYTFNKAVTGLDKDDFVASNGTVTSVSAQGNAGDRWAVTVTPAANVAGGNIGLSLKPGVVSDAAGNTNFEHRQAVQGLDTLAPTASLQLDRATFLKASANGNVAMTSKVTLTFSEPVPNLSADALSVSNAAGTVTSLSKVGDGKTWTATFTPKEADAASSVKLALAGGYLDAAGNAGVAAESASLRINVVAPVVNIESDKTALKASDTSANLVFSFSEPVSGFEQADVVVTGGSLSNFAKVSDTRWSAVFTPTPSATPTAPTIAVADNVFSSTSANIAGIGKTLALKANLTNPSLTLALEQVATDGLLTFGVLASDPAVKGLTTGGFSSTNGTVVAGSLLPVQGEPGKYTLQVRPTASGPLVLSAADGAGSTDLPTTAAQSASWKIVQGTTGNDTVDLTDAREIVVLGGGNDTIKIDDITDSLVAGRDVIANVSDGDLLDLSALLNKTGTARQYFSMIDESYKGPAVAGWLKTLNMTEAGALGTVGDNELRFIERVDANGTRLTLSLAYDTDSTVGSTAISQVGEVRLLAADAPTLSGFLDPSSPNDSGYAIADRIAPTISVAMQGGKTVFPKVNAGSATVEFTSNEIIDSLSPIALQVTGGQITAPQRSSADPRVWTATFTPSPDQNVTQASISVKAGSYFDYADNAGLASNTVALSINSNAPVLTLVARQLTADGDILFDIASSDPALTGLAASDFSATNATVVASSFQAVTGQAGKYTLRVTPTATGEVVLTAAEGAGTANSLASGAASSPAVPVIKGTSGNDTINLTAAREGVILGGGNDVVRIDDVTDSSGNAPDMLAGVSAGDKLDISALLKKANTATQYVSAVDSTYTGPAVAGWLKAIDRSSAGDLGTVGDNELRYMVKKVNDVDRISMVYDTDSSLGTPVASAVSALDLVTTDAATLQGFLAGTNNRGFWIADTTAPSMAVSIDKTTFTKTNAGTATVTFTSNEILTALPKASVTVAGGAISDPVQSSNDPRVWTATFTPSSTATVTSGSISVANAAYQDFAGNAGSASNAVNLMLNVPGASLALNWVDATPTGQMTYMLVSDMAVTGLAVSDFAGTGYTVNSVTEVTGSAGKQFMVNIIPTASGNLTLTMPAGAGMANGLPTPAVTANPAAVQVIQASANGGEISVTGAADRFIVLGTGVDTVKIPTIAAGSGQAYMGVIAGAMPGDRLDIGSALKAAGYASVVEADAPESANAFATIANMTLTQDATAKVTYVSFDVMLKSPTVSSSRINGITLDLSYDANVLVADSIFVSPRTYPVGTKTADLLNTIVVNQAEGKIAATSSNQALFNTYDITDAKGKVLTIDLTVNALVNSFQVGFDSGSGNSISLVSGTAPALVTGSSKTGYVGGSPLIANVLHIDGTEATSEAAMPATPGDNQLRYVQVVESPDSNGVLLKFRFDTDPAVGKTALSPLIEADLLSTDLTAFLNTDYVKLI
jgi:hypothetical protein